MRRTLIAVAFFATAGSVPVASADQGMYFNELHGRNKLFVSLTNDQALRLGHAACGAMRAGINAGTSMGEARHRADLAVAKASHESGVDLDLASAMNITQAAEHNLC